MSSQYASSSQSTTEPLEPRPLELSLNPENGSLLTAPLTQVLLATTDALYQDLYNMTHGELDVTTSAQIDTDAQADPEESTHGGESLQTRQERMSNLSFAQRRHELTWRLAQHGRALQHVAGLTASAASSSLSQQVQVSSTALQHTRTAWVQADEAQDAMYFFHAQLFPARAAPHDVYGACDVHLDGKWYDLPADLRLPHDRYDTVKESQYSKAEVNERWLMAVRDKLLSGEAAWRKRQSALASSLPSSQQEQEEFDLSLRGGVLTLTHGAPRKMGDNETPTFPIQALLTIVSSSEFDEWSLLSLDVKVQAKTGEFNHQLEASNRQRYSLHRLAALAMTREEARVRRIKQAAQAGNDKDKDNESEQIVARPLHALFQVAHTFSLSWQLELLSAQAQALRRGAWSAGEGNQIHVTPVHFLDDETSNILGSVSISFWRVDDAYGPPSMGDLMMENETGSHNGSNGQTLKKQVKVDSTNQLVLSIRAEKTVGIKVALSGGAAIRGSMDVAPHTKETIHNLLAATSNPFALSASDALLAATRLCTERKCDSAVQALLRNSGSNEPFLPSWISLRSERGNISVAAKIQFHGVDGAAMTATATPLLLFRLACDARTGSFTPTFPRTMNLLRHLACNDVRSSESVALRIANTPGNRRRAAASKSTGRLVKDAFDGLVRSMNVLGQRVGVGGSWDDKDDQSASIRERAIALACRDLTVSMTKCCGLAALFGLTPIAVGTSLGLNAVPDVAGEALDSASGVELFAAPPLSVLLDQQMIETAKTTSDGVSTKNSFLKQRLFAFSFGHNREALTIYPLEVLVHLDSPSSVPERKSCKMISFEAPSKEETYQESSLLEPPRKKARAEDVVGSDFVAIRMVVPEFAAILSATISKMKQPMNGSLAGS